MPKIDYTEPKEDKNGLLLRLLGISAIIFISTAVVSREYHNITDHYIIYYNG